MRQLVVTNLSVGREVGGGDLQRHRELGLLAHLVRQEVGLAHHGVGAHHLLLQLRQALAERPLPANNSANAYVNN